jgi:hypothetical protein
VRPLSLTLALLLAAPAFAEPPADAPVQKPVTLVYPDGGRCQNEAAVQASDKLLADARAEQVRPVLLASGVGLVVGVVLGFVAAGLVKKP